MSRRHKQTETTQDITEPNEGNLEIVTQSSNRILRAAKSLDTVYDGLMFTPNSAVGLSSDVIHFTDEAEVVYTCADFYCLWNENQRKDIVIDRNSHRGQLQLIYSIRTGKMNLLASSEIVNGCVSRVDIYDREAKRHHSLNLVSTGRALGMHIINPGQLGIMLFDETTRNDKPVFSVCLFDVQKEISCVTQERSARALKLVASNFGDFTMILTRENVYELEIDMYNKKMDLSEFDLKRFIEAGEECIDACFLKDTIKLVIITNRMRVFLFDGRLLVSKRELIVPIENIVPFENTQQMVISQSYPLQTTEATFKKLSMPKSIDSSASEILVLFEDQSIALFKLEGGKLFNFERSYELPGEPFKDTQVKSVKLVNGDVMALLNRKTLEVWRMRVSKKFGQENEQICPKISALNYLAQPSLHLWDFCAVFKTLYTLHRDKVFRSWHFEQGLKFSKAMFETPLAMSVHPLGFQLTISFKQLTRLYILKQDKLDVIFTLKVRNISGVKYSPDGNRLMILDSPNVHIINPYNYQTLRIFQATLSNVNEIGFYRKSYFLKNESYLWLFDDAGNKLAEKKTLLYDMYGQANVTYCDGRKIRLYNSSAQQYQDIEIQLNHILEEHEKVTCIRVVELYGIVLLGTSDGYVIEMLWPIPEQALSYRYKVSNSSILSLKVTESYKQLLCVTSTSEIITLDIAQYINGGQTVGVYVFSDAKVNDVYEYEINEQVCRRSILNREYFFDGYGMTGIRAVEERAAEAQEQSANLALIRGEVEYQMQKNTAQVNTIMDTFKNTSQTKLANFDLELKKIQEEQSTRTQKIRQQLKFNLDEYLKKKESASDKFDKELLEIIKRSQELNATKLREEERLRNIMADLRLRNEEIMKGLRHDKSQKFEILMEKYRKLMEAVDEDRQKMASIEFEGDLEQKLFRQRVQEELNDQLEKATLENEHLNEDITKNRKGVANFKKRAKYLENLIDDTEKQIKQLEEDQKEYRQKTGEMVEELKKKEILINQKEEMIKRLLVENKHVRGFKDIHEYLMKEYTNETIPNEIKAEQLEDKVKRMNIELLQEIEWRKEAETDLSQASIYMRQLKAEQSSKQKLRHILQTNVNSFAFLLKNMINSVSPDDWTETLRQIYEMRFKNSNLSEILTKKVVGHETNQIGQEEMQMKKRIEDVMRQKEELSKRQVKEETIAHFQEKYKQELFKKYHGENTELVKEYNLLTKEQKLLNQQLVVLRQSHAYLLKELESDNVIVRSLSVTNHKAELKPTPFQRYQLELSTLKKIPSQGKSTARLSTSRHDNSTTWLKGLIKQVDASKSKLETAEIVRAKVKSFVNPELSKPQTSRYSNKMDSPQIPSAIDIFNKLSLESRQVRTKSQLIKSVLRRPTESQR